MDIKNIQNYAKDLPGDVLPQLYEEAKKGYVTRCALMPDAHLGYTVPIGTAIELDKHVSPHIIGLT